MLTGTLKSPTDLPEGDYRRMFPKYQDGNFQENLKLVKEIEKMAERKGCTAAQIALGWLVALSKRPDMPTIIPIPGGSMLFPLSEERRFPLIGDQQSLRSILRRMQL